MGNQKGRPRVDTFEEDESDANRGFVVTLPNGAELHISLWRSEAPNDGKPYEDEEPA